MKKSIISTVILCLSVIATSAQKYKIGIKAGVNASKISGTSFNDEFKLSYHAGVFGEFEINKKLGIQPEIIFSQSQGSVVNTGTVLVFTNTNFDYSLNYINIPLLLRYKIGKVLVLNAGPQYSILLNDDTKLYYNSVKSAFKSGDFAIVGGLQLEFKYLRVYARYNIGLDNVNDLNNNENWKSQQIQAGIGFKF